MEIPGISPVSAANYRMIDIAEKKDTQRRAVASGVFRAAPDTLKRIRDRTLPKGDVLTLAEVAGIQGAKKTSDLLPLCHPLALTSVRVWTECLPKEIRVFCEAKVLGKTGVEMEALAGVSAALLCIYDLTKGVDPVLEFGSIRLEVKEGGKSGRWVNPNSPGAHAHLSPVEGSLNGTSVQKKLAGIEARVVVMSDRCHQGIAEDRSGPVASQWISDHGGNVLDISILPDDSKQLFDYLSSEVQRARPLLVVISGGTGLSPRDITPETIERVSREFQGREIPGLGEYLRNSGAEFTPASWLSRSSGTMIGQALVLSLPGSPKAVVQGLNAVGGLIPHLLQISQGGNHG